MSVIKSEFNVKILKKILEHRYYKQPELMNIKFRLLSSQIEYSKVYDLEEIAKINSQLDDYEKIRWKNQIRNTILNQQKIKDSRVAVFGCGGVGTNVLVSLAYFGIYNFKIVDYDKIELSNLNEQTLYCPDDIGKLKVNKASEQLEQINPRINIITYNMAVKYPLELSVLELNDTNYPSEIKNVNEIIKWADYVVCSLDYYGGPYLINDLCIKNQKPYYWGACNYFLGDMFIYHPKKKIPCLRCALGPTDFSNQTNFMRYQKPEDEYKAINLTSTNIIIGTFISENIIKDICEIENINNGHYIIYDGYEMKLYSIPIISDINCKCSFYKI